MGQSARSSQVLEFDEEDASAMRALEVGSDEKMLQAIQYAWKQRERA